MWKILAISGGLDSACLLDMMKDEPNILIAHFNHGTRPSANDDEKFVENLARKYNKKFVVGHANLGEGVSEEKARKARYDFLYGIASEYGHASIFTAHHLDDLLETIVINLLRGTGWRGLVPLDAPNIIRPFIDQNLTKADLLKYAAANNLTFREDPTNHEDKYLRNRLRDNIKSLPPETKHKLVDLYHKQKNIKAQAEQILASLLPPDRVYQRSWLRSMGDDVALEFLRAATKSRHISLTRPQLQDFLNAIQTYAPGKSFNLPGGELVKIHKTYFVL